MPIIFLFLLMLSFPAVGLTQVDPQLVELAKKEGELVAYSSSSTEEVRNMVDGFRKQYPFINASSYRSGDYALLNRVRTEAKAGRYAWDVLDMTTYPGYWLAKEGFFAKYSAPERKYIREGHLDDQSPPPRPVFGPEITVRGAASPLAVRLKITIPSPVVTAIRLLTGSAAIREGRFNLVLGP